MRAPSIILSLTFLACLFSKSRANSCVGQGPGACQLDITGHPVYTDGGTKYAIIWQNATIYDHKCKVLGGVERPIQDVAIDSQLPYTVVLTWLRTDSQYVEFCYASKCYQGNFWCTAVEEFGMSAIECLHAFECANMDRLVSSS